MLFLKTFPDADAYPAFFLSISLKNNFMNLNVIQNISKSTRITSILVNFTLEYFLNVVVTKYFQKFTKAACILFNVTDIFN